MSRPGVSSDDRDPFAAYLNGKHLAVQAAAPREPSEKVWDQVRYNIEQQLTCRRQQQWSEGQRSGTRLAGIAWIVASAAAIILLTIYLAIPNAPRAVEIVNTQYGEDINAPAPHTVFDLLPIAASEDVVLYRVPGDGLLPVGTHPLSGPISLATIDDVQVDEENSNQHGFCVSEGGSPMIFASRPR